MRSDLGFYWKWLDYHLVLRLLALLPPRLAYAGARARARYRYWKRPHAREAARTHMRRHLPGLDERALERKVVEFFFSPCLDELETYFLPRLNLDKLQRLMHIEGRENLERGLEKGNGAILVSSHSASIGLYFVSLGLMGYKANVVARSLEEADNPLPPAVRSYGRRRVSWIEGHLGRPFLEPSRGNAVLLAERLRANELVVAVLDVPPDIVRSKMTVNFFGRPCYFPSGFARLAQETGSAIVPVENHYLPDWHHQRLVFHEPLFASGDLAADVQHCVSKLESLIRKHPSQWYVWDNLPMLWAPESAKNGNPA